MSTTLIDLEDRIITDTGTMVAKHQLLTKLALQGRPIENLPFVAHPDIDMFHQRRGSFRNAKRWVEDENLVGPPLSSFDWNIPEEYLELDIMELCEAAMVDRGLDTEDYIDRLGQELIQVEEREMDDFLRCLIYITDTLRQNKVVWGLGRGSSCASLILFLLGVNKVDPVRYDIPMEEFYK